ncbi:MAG: hypothetical protein KF690_10225 [Bacteroidetes bacterium]|nr:hypothetical protein [Bacteroidota bacterium]
MKILRLCVITGLLAVAGLSPVRACEGQASPARAVLQGSDEVPALQVKSMHGACTTEEAYTGRGCTTRGGCAVRRLGLAASAALLIITLATTAVEKLKL